MSLTGFISYKRVGWTGQTPWNPTNLNIMDKGIKDNNDMIANLRSEVSALNSNIDFSYLVKKAKMLDAHTDLNIVIESGIYYLSNAATWGNLPNSEVTNCYLLVFSFNANRCTQIILPGNDEFAYYRSKYTDNKNWQKWKTIN